ncbi:MAG: 2-oxoacid:ferredoxin oxidoreductase subunit beta, partial [Planctomycetota bacterium]
MTAVPAPLTKKDFKSDQDVRWCPGCGDYAILNAVQTAFANLGKKLHETVIISGIGCSSRFPYYMETYGFHTIHGRAPAVATGAKLANPNLDVWVITGDGDSLSIGGNHLIHALRRNVGLKIILFNNRIYGLTKGQYSPTSEKGKRTKSTPMGSLDEPFSPIALALGAGATFVARSVDIFAPHLISMIERMDAHRGTALLEVYQNCNIFNDGAFRGFTEKDVRSDRVVELQHGKPLRFGAEDSKAITFDGRFVPHVVDATDGLSTWDECAPSPAAAMALAHASEAELPVPIGVFR